MNGLSLSELCCLFCCPPCPSQIASKLAFLPPEPTYTFLPDPESGPNAVGAGHRSRTGTSATGVTEDRLKLHLTDRAEFQYSQRELDMTEVFTTRSSRGNKVACMYIRCTPNARFTVLFSHGNAVDLGQMSTFYIGLGTRINCNIFSYDYSGYGVSSGKPSEKNLYADIDAAWHALRTRYGISPENIILYGQSIGTVPTVDLSSRYECAAVVLHSPLTSGMRVAFPDTKKTYCFDPFPRSGTGIFVLAYEANNTTESLTGVLEGTSTEDSIVLLAHFNGNMGNNSETWSIEKVSKITSPVLIIHGTEDEVIDFTHGLALFERCPKAVEPLWVEGAGHNDIELYSQYLERLRRFIGQEVAAQHT